MLPTNIEAYLSKLNTSNSIRHGIRQAIPILSLFVVLGVFWGLKLTGITMAGEAFCGHAEHVHSEECPLRNLICEMEESEGHAHSEACIYRELICETEESEGHAHSDECSVKTLICEQEEREGHTHGETCMTKTLICTQTEDPGHTHGETCGTVTVVCGLEESVGHTHGEECTAQTLVCTLAEDDTHAHGDACYAPELICGLEEAEGHTHGETCIETSLTCTLEEYTGHIHAEECYMEEWSCTLEEIPGHFHTDECYRIEADFGCGQEEWEGHTHGDDCYRLGEGFGCGLTEAEGHVHTELCITELTQFGCEQEAFEGHTHGDECYDILEYCPLEEHIHIETCYSDITADLETSDDWEMSLAGLVRSNSMAENVMMVAQSQLGVAESTLNFQVDENGIRRGITRYGQWYGHPYGDWSAMFASFCLYYAGVEEVPANAGSESLRLDWEAAGLYLSAAEYSPMPGNLLFLDKDQNETADAVAIIVGFEENVITVIEGDLENVVAETTYAIEDPAILGYGLLPYEGDLISTAAESATVENAVFIAKTTPYDPSLFTGSNRFVLYTASGFDYYAFDGNGNAVQVYIDDQGNISAAVEDPDSLLWSFTNSGGSNSYLIRNNRTGRYMHAYSGGVTTSGAYTSVLLEASGGVQVRSNWDYAMLNVSQGVFQLTQSQANAAVYQFGMLTPCTVWLDGTNGGLMSLGDSPNVPYSASVGDTLTLPTTWQSPSKYSYSLRGWYDVVNSKYYPPGAEVTVTGDMVFYADWVSSSYNIGQFNSQVANTVSTNEFVTTRLFDYGPLFNVLSTTPTVTFTEDGHTETWQLLTEGTNPYNGEQTLDYIFRDWDAGSRDITYPANTNSHNTYNADIALHTGLYNGTIGNLLFGTDNSFDPATGTGVIGKQYLGTADHLFQLCTDPNDARYGYYYYDSELNAASYNRSARRFYVYEYLERTTDSAGSSKYSDFLPLNSPYVNTNGRTPATYSYSGANGEYAGTTHYTYEAKDAGESPVGINYLFGMSIDIDFYLPNLPGTRASDGSYGNQDLYGKDMHFKFSGDDDVWVFVDGKLVLDLGGIHGIESGDINFSTGVVTVDGVAHQAHSNALRSIPPGEHTLTIYYLERGSSQSNCSIFFNLAPRFSFSIQKEDVLTREVLNGAQFSVYTDLACTVPAELWPSKAAHDRGEAATNVFTVTNGVANMWGMGAGSTYYIKETKPPDEVGYGYAHGIIQLDFDMEGFITYSVHVTEDNGNLTPGFTVHGIKMDEESQSAFIVATNMPDVPNQEPTAVSVRKVWNDNKNHSGDSVIVYLTVTNPDGTVRRIREITLSDAINWTYTWENLPKLDDQGNEVVYGIQEAMFPGYVSVVEEVAAGSSSAGGSGEATTASAFENGKTYLLHTRHGYLGADSTGLVLITDQSSAQGSDSAQWVATVNADGTVTLKTKNGYTLYYEGYAFRASSSPGAHPNLRYANGLLYCYIDHGAWQETQYPVDNESVSSNITYNHILYTTNNSSDALSITPQVLGGSTSPPPVTEGGSGNYVVTNTPTSTVTSLTVKKAWDTGAADDPSLYSALTVQMNLLANGKDAGLQGVLSLKNNWRYTFEGLPLYDSNGNLIHYTVEEVSLSDEWRTHYGEIISSGGNNPTYSTTVTNSYYSGGPQLPSTGSAARLLYILCGSSIMLLSLVYGIGSWRKRERRIQ